MATSFNTARSAVVRRGVGESLIYKRRQREDYLASYTTSAKGVSTLHARAEWEDSLYEKGAKKQVQRTIAKLNNQHASELHSRRLSLAQLYNCEMEKWRNACLANVETPEDRKQKMIQRALALKERREKERQAIVEEKRMQQYRESSDEVRGEDSLKGQQIVLNDREKQLQEKAQIAQQERVLELKMDQLWDEDRQKKEERERQDCELAIQRNSEMKHMLDLQVELVQKQRAELRERTRKEDVEQLNEWQRLQQVEADGKQCNRAREIERARDVKRLNHEQIEATRVARDRMRVYDQRLLEHALAQEAATQQHEREKQTKCRQTQVEYQQTLKRQMETKADDVARLDAMCKEMQDSVWAKREAEHKAEEAARQELLRLVVISRTAQRAKKQALQAQANARDTDDRHQLDCTAHEALHKELHDQAERRNERKLTQCEQLRQINDKRVAGEQRQQGEFLELKRMQFAEKQHQERVKDFASHMPPTNFRRKTAQWYFDV